MNPSIYPKIVPANTFDKIMEYEFLPASGYNKERYDNERYDFFPAYGNQELSQFFANDGYSNAGGRRRACRAQGLTGKALRQCARDLKASGWKIGQPFPSANAELDEIPIMSEQPQKMGADINWTPIVIGSALLIAVVGGAWYMWGGKTPEVAATT